MNEWVELQEIPAADEIYMLAGWRQWADAGSISSALPQYLIEQTGARKIGEIKSDHFYLFQIPGTHHFLRPEVKLDEGYRKELQVYKNEIFYAGDDQKGLVIFLGDEPHLHVEQYAKAFFDIVDLLKVKRVVAVGGVYGPMPFNKDREISCVYSLRPMKTELANYAVKFSDYEGGTTIGTYLVDKAESRQIEFLVFYAFVPAYDFGEAHSNMQPSIRIETDFKAWLDLMRRLKHMFNLDIDLSELERESEELVVSMDARMAELEDQLSKVDLKEYLQILTQGFTENPFMPLDDVWERELGDLFDDLDDDAPDVK